MSRQHSKQFRAQGVMLLSTGLVLVCGPTGWAAEGTLDSAGYLSVSLPQGGFTEQPWLTGDAFREHAAALERAQSSSHPEAKRIDPNASAAPRVDVRVTEHEDFERIVFEWPAATDYGVVQHAEQVTIAFSKAGRIDLSRITDRLGRVVGAWTKNGDATASVTLRVLPDTRVRAFSLGDSGVAIDLFGATAAQALAPPTPDPGHDIIQELRRALEQRDAVIEQLLTRFDQLATRFDQLERAVGLSSGELERVTAGQAGATPSVGGTLRPRPRSQSMAAHEAPLGQPPAARSAPTPEEPSATTGQGQGPEITGAPRRRETAQSEAPAPGQLEVDEEAAERALDFTLVQEGALLLPFGRAEFTPSLTYTRRTGDFPVVLGGPGSQVVAEEDIRRNEFGFFASLLVGLPFDSQLELSLPYNLVEQKVVDSVGGVEVQESSDTGYGLGDVSVGFAKTVLRERNWWPDVVLRANWDTGTGESADDNVVLDGGFQGLTGSISLAKRQDPLVFVGGAFYEAAFEHNNVDPGDTMGFSIGTFLAASPNTSLRVVLNQNFIDDFKLDGESINGSDQVQSILTFGASAILGRNVLLDSAVGVGLTDDSPDYSVSISLPIRFSTPGL